MRRWLLIGAVLLAGFLALSVRLFAFPSEEVPRRADAVVVLAGKWEVRLPVGRRLHAEGVAPVLVLSEDSEDDFPRELCRRASVTCFQADPYSTTGEAATFAELARRRGWRSILLVTSDYHLTRASLLFRRCFDGSVYTTAGEESARDALHGAAWEWPKLLHALTVRRGC